MPMPLQTQYYDPYESSQPIPSTPTEEPEQEYQPLEADFCERVLEARKMVYAKQEEMGTYPTAFALEFLFDILQELASFIEIDPRSYTQIVQEEIAQAFEDHHDEWMHYEWTDEDIEAAAAEADTTENLQEYIEDVES